MSESALIPGPEKSAFRRRLKAEVATLDYTEKAEQSTKICRNLLDHPIWQSSQSILGYIPLKDEPDIMSVLELALAEGKSLFLPAFEEKTGLYTTRVVTDLSRDLVAGRFGIREPGEFCALGALMQLDFSLVPGVGFDLNGCRLGRGNGYYDRLLSEAAGLKCGLAFDCQLTDDIPKEPHDIQMNWVVLPSRWLNVNQASRGL